MNNQRAVCFDLQHSALTRLQCLATACCTFSLMCVLSWCCVRVRGLFDFFECAVEVQSGCSPVRGTRKARRETGAKTLAHREVNVRSRCSSNGAVSIANGSAACPTRHLNRPLTLLTMIASLLHPTISFSLLLLQRNHVLRRIEPRNLLKRDFRR